MRVNNQKFNSKRHNYCPQTQRLTVSSGLLDVIRLHALQGPLSARCPLEAAQLVDGLVPIGDGAVSGGGAIGDGHAVELLVLCIGQQLCTLLKALGMGQVGSSQPTGVPQTARQESCLLVRLTPQQMWTHNTHTLTHSLSLTHVYT